MKKYCFTNCFKKKISKFWDTTIQIVLGITIAFLLTIVFSFIMGCIGYLGDLLRIVPEGKNYIESGVALTTILGIIIFMSIYIVKLGKWFFNTSYNFIKSSYEGEPFECKIFQVCEEE